MTFCILFGIVGIKGKKWIIPACIALVAVIILIVVALPLLHQQSLYHKAWLRIHLESKFLPIIFQKPLTGWGLGSFKFIGPSIWNIHTGTYGTMVDGWNDYLERGVELGLPIVLVMIGMFVDTFKRFIKRNGNIGLFCGLLVVPIGCLFHNYVNHASLSVLMICLYAGAYKLYEV
jgi:O-antigen ligase